jgi:cob(I)alamin adenosyltransferase
VGAGWAIAEARKPASVRAMRIDRITTRTGDRGETGLADGSRLPKDHPLIAAIGAIDEANCVLGMARLEALPDGLAEELARVQNDLFDLGADLATPPGGEHEARVPRMATAQVERLDQAVAEAVARLAPLRSFVLPAGSHAATHLHLARTVVRRAERDLVAAMRALPERAFNPDCLRYLNRLSDACFAWARRANDDGRADVAWQPSANR